MSYLAFIKHCYSNDEFLTITPVFINRKFFSKEEQFLLSYLFICYIYLYQSRLLDNSSWSLRLNTTVIHFIVQIASTVVIESSFGLFPMLFPEVLHLKNNFLLLCHMMPKQIWCFSLVCPSIYQFF